MPKKLTLADFKPHLNDTFEVHTANDGDFELVLVEAVEQNTPKTEGFSLLFRGPTDREFPHATHRVKHKKMGEFDLGLGPILSAKQDGIYYEAVFNRLVEK